jgi:hypothetical protein
MRRIIQITESQLKNVILQQLSQSGVKGLYKERHEKKLSKNEVNESLYSVFRDIKQSRKKYRY